MSDYDRGKYGKKKFSVDAASGNSSGRSFFNGKGGYNSGFGKAEKESTETVQLKQPTILLKAREPSDEVTTSPKRSKEPESTTNVPSTSESTSNPVVKLMTKSCKLIEENAIVTETLQEYVEENTDFLVVGAMGPPSVGKSTILNLLAHNKVTDSLKKAIFKNLDKPQPEQYGDNIKILTDSFLNLNVDDENLCDEVFKIETVDDIEKNSNGTSGIDIFISSNRVIFLDCQPFSSVSALHDLIENEHKRSLALSEFVSLESSAEIQGLQYLAFLMSVCHVIILVQDWFFDSNVMRFVQTAEMLKPSMSNPEDELVDHSPHLVLVHNKANVEDFSPRRFKIMQDIYRKIFSKSKLHLESNLGLGNGRLISHLNRDNCGNPINLYLIPECDPNFNSMYGGHPDIENLIKRLKANILGAIKNPLTHVQLTEKNWLTYCSKVWETIKKSSFFVEYTKLMP